MQPNTLPTYLGLYRSIVTNNVDSTNQNKIKVVCPQVAGNAEIRSAEPVNPQEQIPAIGSIVWVGFSGGDITKPYYLANSVTPYPEISVVLDWQTPSLAAGYTENGNTNGTVKYRVVNFLGYNQVQWMGGLNLTYPGSSLANSSQPFASVLNPAAQPSSLRSLPAACSTSTSTTQSLKFDTSTTGLCTIVGTNTSTIQPPWISLNNLSYFI